MKAIVDFSNNIGKIKAVNGVSNGPICHGLDLSEYFKEAHISCVRYHDTDGSAAYGRYMIDVSRIFEDFDADEYDEKNYRFEHTDKLILAAKDCNAEIIYRLGESIDHTVYKRYSRPPKGFDKWVRICLQIIKHYNDGWANGYKLGLKYWEIWNEPEGQSTDGMQPMWSGGTFDQMLDLYKKIATAIKVYDNNLKVGGLSFMYCDFAVEPFLKFCRQENLPVDFLSFHHYAQDLDWTAEQTNTAKSLLDKYGFNQSEIIIAEWSLLFLENYDGIYWDFIADPVHQREKNRQLYENQKNNLGASFIAAFLIKLNDLPVDKAILYDFDPNSNWCGLFDRYLEPQKAWFSFKSYGEMRYESVFRAQAESEAGCIIASVGKERNTVIYSNFRDKFGNAEFVFNNLGDKRALKGYAIDEDHKFEKVIDRKIDDGDTVKIDVAKNSTLVFYFE